MSKSRVVTIEEQKKLEDHFKVVGDKVVCKKAYSSVPLGKIIAENQKTKRAKIFFFGGKSYLVHRVIYFLSNGVWPKGVVDHINGDSQDNRPENLRDIPQSLNTKSYGPAHKDSTSGFRGVHWFKRDSRWQAQIMYNGKKYHLGYFDSEREAALVWNYKALELGFNKESFNHVF